jgi:hypothetical protein
LQAIRKDDPADAIRQLEQLSLKKPYATQKYVALFIDEWCKTCMAWIAGGEQEKAGERLRWLYTVTPYGNRLDAALANFFERAGEAQIHDALPRYEQTVHLAMKAHYFCHVLSKPETALPIIRQCFSLIATILREENRANECWFLVRKLIRHLEDTEAARAMLEGLLGEAER